MSCASLLCLEMPMASRCTPKKLMDGRQYASLTLRDVEAEEWLTGETLTSGFARLRRGDHHAELRDARRLSRTA